MEKKIYHKGLAAGRWKELSLVEQMGNIGSEVGRAIKWFKQGDKKSFTIAFEKPLELFDLTLEDERWKNKREKLNNTRNLFYTLVTDTTLTDELVKNMNRLDEYFLRIGIAVNARRYRSTN